MVTSLIRWKHYSLIEPASWPLAPHKFMSVLIYPATQLTSFNDSMFRLRHVLTQGSQAGLVQYAWCRACNVDQFRNMKTLCQRHCQCCLWGTGYHLPGHLHRRLLHRCRPDEHGSKQTLCQSRPLSPLLFDPFHTCCMTPAYQLGIDLFAAWASQFHYVSTQITCC